MTTLTFLCVVGYWPAGWLAQISLSLSLCVPLFAFFSPGLPCLISLGPCFSSNLEATYPFPAARDRRTKKACDTPKKDVVTAAGHGFPDICDLHMQAPRGDGAT